jgi:hypothetical protein
VIRNIGSRGSRDLLSWRTARVAARMLPPDVRAAIAAVKRQSVGTRAFTPATAPRYLFTVRTDRPRVFESLQRMARARPDLVGVVLDRRWLGERRHRHEPGYPERRGGERRCSVPDGTWTRRGFLLVESQEASERAATSRRAALATPPARPVETSSTAPVEQAQSVGRVEPVARLPLPRTAPGRPRPDPWVAVVALGTLLVTAAAVLELSFRSSRRPSAGSGPAFSSEATVERAEGSVAARESRAPDPVGGAAAGVAPPIETRQSPSVQGRPGPPIERAQTERRPAPNDRLLGVASPEPPPIAGESRAATSERLPIQLPPPPPRSDEAVAPDTRAVSEAPRTGPAATTVTPDPSEIIDWLLKEYPRTSN